MTDGLVKVVDYKLLEAFNTASLEKAVKDAFWHGWRLYGSPFTTSRGGVPVYLQAVVKSQEGAYG